jgi:integrase
VRGMRSSMNKLVAAFGPRLFHTLTAPELQKWLWELPHGNNTRRHLAKDFHTVWEWAVLKLSCAKVNPWPAVEVPDKDTVKIGILTPHECFLLLRAALAPEFFGLLPGLVCCLLAGVRPKECARLRWDHIRLGTRRPIINLTAEVAKTRHRRVVHLSASAVLWLSLIPEHQRTGKIKAGDWTHMFPALRRHAGVHGFSRNCLRHSYASYHASVHGEVRTAEQLGHTNLGTIKSHYQENVMPEEADVFWAITPKSTWKAMEKILRAA